MLRHHNDETASGPGVPPLPGHPSRRLFARDASPLVPGQPSRFDVSLAAVGYRLAPGSRWLLTLTTQDWSNFVSGLHHELVPRSQEGGGQPRAMDPPRGAEGRVVGGARAEGEGGKGGWGEGMVMDPVASLKAGGRKSRTGGGFTVLTGGEYRSRVELPELRVGG